MRGVIGHFVTHQGTAKCSVLQSSSTVPAGRWKLAGLGLQGGVTWHWGAPVQGLGWRGAGEQSHQWGGSSVDEEHPLLYGIGSVLPVSAVGASFDLWAGEHPRAGLQAGSNAAQQITFGEPTGAGNPAGAALVRADCLISLSLLASASGLLITADNGEGRSAAPTPAHSPIISRCRFSFIPLYKSPAPSRLSSTRMLLSPSPAGNGAWGLLRLISALISALISRPDRWGQLSPTHGPLLAPLCFHPRSISVPLLCASLLKQTLPLTSPFLPPVFPSIFPPFVILPLPLPRPCPHFPPFPHPSPFSVSVCSLSGCSPSLSLPLISD